MLPSLSPGASLGPYVLAHPLGRGSTATVFLAARADRMVALKVRARGDEELDRRFLREFEALRGLAIPGVVRVHEAGLDDRWLWYAMDVVRGVPIRTWIEEGGATAGRVERLLRVAPALCDALAGIHRTGLVHRDLKPSNVLVDAHGLPHILDFGVARGWVDAEPLTGEGGLVGTIPFMAPEQVAGQPLTQKCDLFAVGLMLHEGVAGKRQRPARAHDWLRLQCLERPRPLAAADPAVPRSVSAVIDQLVAFDPQDRPDAATAAALFRACAAGGGPSEWPEPAAYVGEPEFLGWADAWLKGAGPRVAVLAGPTGSGRRRTAEQVRRRALLGGARTLRGRCRVERPGGAIEAILAELLDAPADTEWRRLVGGGDSGALLEMWPHLPLEPPSGPSVSASAQDVVQATAAALVRAARGRLLLVLEDADEIDRFTARLLERLAQVAPERLSVLCIVDDRHASRRCTRMLQALTQRALATVHRLPALDAAAATRIAEALVPDGVPVSAPGGSPLLACEVGLAALALTRGEPFPQLPAAAFPAAMEDGALHADAWAALGASPPALAGSGALARVGTERWRIAAGVVRAGALARTARRAAEARRLAEALRRDPGSEAAGALVRALLLAEDPSAAFGPALRAARIAQRLGRYREARDWLVLVDSLPRDRDTAEYVALRFSLAACRAGVALAMGAERAREDLVASAVARATNAEERGRATLLAIDLARRKGDAGAALRAALRLFARAPHPTVTLRAGLRAAELRLASGAPDEAAALLERVEAARGGDTEDADQVSIDALHAEVAAARGELQSARARNLDGLRLATRLGYLPGVAAHSLRLGLTHWWLGDRAEAEAAVERARRARLESGERGGAAEATAWLGWLHAGRGDAATAELLGQEARAVARRLNRPDAHALALAVLLAAATARRDGEAAERLLAEHARELRGEPGVFALAAARWWRSCEEHGRALDALAAVPDTGHLGVGARLERARAHLARLERNLALTHVEAARTAARAAGFRELELAARLLRARLEPVSQAEWDGLVAEASASSWVELFLGVLVLDGDRRARMGDLEGARGRFLELAARAAEHGHRPFQDAALEALGGL